jgi:hypothetical protein
VSDAIALQTGRSLRLRIAAMLTEVVKFGDCMRAGRARDRGICLGPSVIRAAAISTCRPTSRDVWFAGHPSSPSSSLGSPWSMSSSSPIARRRAPPPSTPASKLANDGQLQPPQTRRRARCTGRSAAQLSRRKTPGGPRARRSPPIAADTVVTTSSPAAEFAADLLADRSRRSRKMRCDQVDPLDPSLIE